LIERHYRELGRGPKRAIRLGPETPDGPSNPFPRNAAADLINMPRSVAVRNHARIGHAIAKCIQAFLDIAWVDSGCGNANANLSGRGNRVRHLPNRQNFPGRALLFIPSCPHFTASFFFETTFVSISVLDRFVQGKAEILH
jgi:hypothetical protein